MAGHGRSGWPGGRAQEEVVEGGKALWCFGWRKLEQLASSWCESCREAGDGYAVSVRTRARKAGVKERTHCLAQSSQARRRCATSAVEKRSVIAQSLTQVGRN